MILCKKTSFLVIQYIFRSSNQLHEPFSITEIGSYGYYEDLALLRLVAQSLKQYTSYHQGKLVKSKMESGRMTIDVRQKPN